jgi:hypothetical protein
MNLSEGGRVQAPPLTLPSLITLSFSPIPYQNLLIFRYNNAVSMLEVYMLKTLTKLNIISLAVV